MGSERGEGLRAAADAPAGAGGAPVLLGSELPAVARWSERVVVALGQNPGPFTGPGTNTYLVGTGRQRILLDTGAGRESYVAVLERALAETGGGTLQEIVLTHAHPDHIGGVASLRQRFGPLRVSKRPWPGVDERFAPDVVPIDHGTRLATEGATLRAVHTPGHAPDHLCFVLEEERALFSGDNVLGIGTTLLPAESGDLGDYLDSLRRMLDEAPTRIYPAHGPLIADGPAKLREYLAHRLERERQILAVLERGSAEVAALVDEIYAAYPKSLHAAAALQVGHHLRKLEREGRVLRCPDAGPGPGAQEWRRV